MGVSESVQHCLEELFIHQPFFLQFSMDPPKAFLPSMYMFPSLQTAWWSMELRLFFLLIQTIHCFHVTVRANHFTHFLRLKKKKKIICWSKSCQQARHLTRVASLEIWANSHPFCRHCTEGDENTKRKWGLKEKLICWCKLWRPHYWNVMLFCFLLPTCTLPSKHITPITALFNNYFHDDSQHSKQALCTPKTYQLFRILRQSL